MNRVHRRWSTALLLTAAATLPSQGAFADGAADEAEADFRMGVARFQARDLEAALAWFMASFRLAPNPNVGFNIARTFDALERLPEAHRWYQSSIAMATSASLRSEIEAALARLEARVAIVEVVTSPPGATVYLDRRELGTVATTPARIAVPHGAHHVLVELAGYVPVDPVDVDAQVGVVRRAEFTLRRIVGQVQLGGDEGVTVTVDGGAEGVGCTTPCALDLVPGLHNLIGSREGYRYDPVTVRVVEGVATPVNLEGRARTGSVVVTTDEPDATVEIDGHSMGFTPAVLPNVAVGRRRIVIRLEGYEPVEREVDVTEGAQTELRDVRLDPRRTVTTASRVEETYEATPASISVVSPQELEAFRYPTIAEALRGLRGVSLTNDSMYNGIGIRGLGQPNDYGNRLLVLQDGAVLNDNLLYQSFTGYDGRVDLGDVQRIELVRGPGSVLYGTGAVSGLVNLITPSGDRPTTASASVSAAGQRIGRARVHTHVRMPNGGFDASVSGAYGDGRTVDMTDPGTGTSTRVTQVDQFNAVSSVGRFDYRDLHVQWLGNRRDQTVPTGSYGTLLGSHRTRYRDGRGMLEVRYEPRLGDHTQLTARIAANMTRYVAAYAYDDGAGGTTISREQYDGQWLVSELRVVSRPVESLQIVAGAEVQASVRASLVGREDGATDRYLDASNPYQIFSAYAVAEYAPTSWFRASAGLRGDVWHTTKVDFSPPYALSPRLAAIFRPWHGGVIKLLGGRAFRAPSTYELTYDDAGASQVRAPSGSLGPESVWSGELEISHRFEDDWTVLGSGHYQHARNFIVTQDAPAPNTGLLVYANASDSIDVAGGDFELRKDWRDGWMMSLTYGYLSANYRTLPDDAGTSSRRVPYQPNHFASARTVVPLGRSGVNLAFRATLEGSRRISIADDSTSRYGAVVDTVLSGRGWEDRLRWAFGVYDLFDWRRSLPVGDTLPTNTFTQPGRSIYAEVTLGY